MCVLKLCLKRDASQIGIILKSNKYYKIICQTRNLGLPRNAVMSLGSKVVRDCHEGDVQLWITVFMGLGRAAGPPIGSYVSQTPYAGILMGIILLNLLLVVVFWKRLVPIAMNKYNFHYESIMEKDTVKCLVNEPVEPEGEHVSMK